MIAYVESSALAKLSLAEPGAALLRGRLTPVQHQYCHALGYVELHSAASRLAIREKLTGKQAEQLRASVEQVWSMTTVMPLELAQISRAAGLCKRYQLRAYDAMHLAAAEALMREIGTKNLLWFGFDAAQNAAALALGLRDGMAG